MNLFMILNHKQCGYVLSHATIKAFEWIRVWEIIRERQVNCWGLFIIIIWFCCCCCPPPELCSERAVHTGGKASSTNQCWSHHGFLCAATLSTFATVLLHCMSRGPASAFSLETCSRMEKEEQGSGWATLVSTKQSIRIFKSILSSCVSSKLS